MQGAMYGKVYHKIDKTLHTSYDFQAVLEVIYSYDSSVKECNDWPISINKPMNSA